MATLKEFRKAWVKATTLGFMTFLLMIPISFILLTLFHPPQFEGLSLVEIFQQSAGTSSLEYGWGFYALAQAGHFIHYLIVAGVLGFLQYQILKPYIPNKSLWVILTVLGLELILLGDLLYMGLSTGGAPGPLEPLLIGLGGGSLMALMQYLYLRSVGIKRGKWVGWWILGIIVGILASAVFIFIYEFFLIEWVEQAVSPLLFLIINWLSFILPYFTLIGFFAGWFSAKPLYKALEASNMTLNMRT